ncbi:hypothetical protein DB44_CW00980 [Candidatus Protochlamydia amoebophila]|uniref:Uncharacterized protein n=1 Tax=Candidatus Protochlamydia amoebophila TaxID=362787 RepID=A0A0C1JKV8_9BACT|nr:hypothetical protein DB44_CW00980 [Candidatus Protochlamydia amoebophila]
MLFEDAVQLKKFTQPNYCPYFKFSDTNSSYNTLPFHETPNFYRPLSHYFTMTALF